MFRISFSLALAITLVCSVGNAKPRTKRKIACKVPTNAASCYWTRGRLSFYNGTPAFRLWQVGTHHLLGIYSGPSADRLGLDNEAPEFPSSVTEIFDPLNHRIFGEFEVCPLEKLRPGAMQAACIEAAKNLIEEK